MFDVALIITESLMGQSSHLRSSETVKLTFKSLKTIVALRADKGRVASDVEGINNISTLW